MWYELTLLTCGVVLGVVVCYLAGECLNRLRMRAAHDLGEAWCPSCRRALTAAEARSRLHPHPITMGTASFTAGRQTDTISTHRAPQEPPS